MADDRVHPVPCVFGLSILSPLNHLHFPASNKRSLASFRLCPPFTRTATSFSEPIFSAALTMSSGVSIFIPDRISASGMLGVIRSASGKNSLTSVPIAPSSISFAPLVATMTGSTTMFLALYCLSFSAIVCIRAELETIPIFTASGKMSVNTASSSFARNSGVTSMMSVTPVVFCAVRAVTALIAYTLLASIVLISAWIPAPPQESLPAIDNAVFISFSFLLTSQHYLFIVVQSGAPDVPLNWLD